MAKNREKKEIIKEEKELEQKVIDLARVTRVVAGGKRMRFRACLAVGDKRGHVGLAIAKGADVSIAINKALTAAKKKMVKVKIVNETIPHRIVEKFKAAYVLLKPAPMGTGIIAGGPVRAILDLAGIKNVVSKMMGSSNKVNNARAVINALQKLRDIKTINDLRK